VVADWHVLVVGQERIVGSKELADAGGVMDGCVEVSVVGRVNGLEERCFVARGQCGADGIAGRFVGGCVQEGGETSSQRRVHGWFAGHEGVEGLCFAGCQDRGRQSLKEASALAFVKVEDEGADADGDAAVAMRAGENAIRKALQGKAAGWVIGRVDPTGAVPLGS